RARSCCRRRWRRTGRCPAGPPPTSSSGSWPRSGARVAPTGTARGPWPRCRSTCPDPTSTAPPFLLLRASSALPRVMAGLGNGEVVAQDGHDRLPGGGVERVIGAGAQPVRQLGRQLDTLAVVTEQGGQAVVLPLHGRRFEFVLALEDPADVGR